MTGNVVLGVVASSRGVSEDAVGAPGSGASEAVDAGAVEPEVASDAADPSLTSGAPSNHLAECSPVLDLASGGRRLALGRQRDVAHTGGTQIILDARFAVAAIGGHRSRRASGSLRPSPPRRNTDTSAAARS